MQFIFDYLKITFIFLLTIIQFFILPQTISNIGDQGIDIDLLWAVEQTETATPTATFTQTEIATATDGTANPSETPSPTTEIIDTATETPQTTSSVTTNPTNTTTVAPSITATRTPDYTNTRGPTETLIPLPSITLLFPVDTATTTSQPDSILASSTVESAAQPSVPETTNGISAQSILLIGTIFLLWVILAIFIIFYLKRMHE